MILCLSPQLSSSGQAGFCHFKYHNISWLMRLCKIIPWPRLDKWVKFNTSTGKKNQIITICYTHTHTIKGTDNLSKLMNFVWEKTYTTCPDTEYLKYSIDYGYKCRQCAIKAKAINYSWESFSDNKRANQILNSSAATEQNPFLSIQHCCSAF